MYNPRLEFAKNKQQVLIAVYKLKITKYFQRYQYTK